ncbi:OFA family MFS transporter [Marinilabiliaceae bacterium ANBcel2]|nr:OFA family MFS transporter [Marinilabiliaceae bacterium ANBcel2]
MSSTKNVSGWVVTIAALGINLILGILYSWGVIKEALVQDGWSNTEASLPYTVCVALLAFVTIFGGRLQDKYGPKIIALTGGILFGSGLLLSAFAGGSVVIMTLTFGVISGLGMGFAYAAATPCAIKWFEPRKKGLIAGIVVAGIGLSAIYIAPLTEFLLNRNGVDYTFLFLGILSLVTLIIFSLILRNPPAGYIPASDKSKPAVKESENYTWRELFGFRSFYLLWMTYLLSATAGLMLIAHIASIANVQADWQAGFILVAVLAIFNATGRVGGGYLSDKVGRTRGLLIVFLVQALNMFLFRFYVDVPLLMFGTAVAGLAYGALFSLFPAITADFFGMKNLGVNYGMIFTGWGIAGIVGGTMGGVIADATGSYNYSYIVAAIMLIVGAFIVKTVKPPVKS